MKEILKEIDDIVEYTKSQLNEYVLPDDDIIFFIRDGFWKTAALLKSYHCNNENKTVYERMKEERDEVKERLDKLNRLLDKVFIEGTVFISETQAHYLKEQRDYMQGYLDTLDKRLEDFEEQGEK